MADFSLGIEAAWAFGLVYRRRTNVHGELCHYPECRGMFQLQRPLKFCSFLTQEAGSKIVNEMGSQSKQTNRIYPMSMFSSEASKILGLQDGLTENDLHLILKFLARDKSRIVYDTGVSWCSSKSVQSKLVIRPSNSRLRARRRPYYRPRTKQ